MKMDESAGFVPDPCHKGSNSTDHESMELTGGAASLDVQSFCDDHLEIKISSSDDNKAFDGVRHLSPSVGSSVHRSVSFCGQSQRAHGEENPTTPEENNSAEKTLPVDQQQQLRTTGNKQGSCASIRREFSRFTEYGGDNKKRLVAILELFTDTSSLEIHNAHELFNPIVFSHFYQNYFTEDFNNFEKHFEPIAKAFVELDTPKPTEEYSEADSLNENKRVSFAPENTVSVKLQLERQNSTKSTGSQNQEGFVREGDGGSLVDQSKRVAKATNRLRLYFHLCIMLLKLHNSVLFFKISLDDQKSIKLSPVDNNQQSKAGADCLGILTVEFFSVLHAQACNDELLENFPTSFCHEYYCDNNKDKVHRKTSIFLPVGSTLICLYIEAPDQHQNLNSLLWSTKLGEPILKHILDSSKNNLVKQSDFWPTEEELKYFKLFPKDKMRGQLYESKKYRLNKWLEWNCKDTDKHQHEKDIVGEGGPNNTEHPHLNTKACSHKDNIFIDRFTVPSPMENQINESEKPKAASKWIDIVVMCKNSTHSSLTKDLKRHCTINVAVVGVSSPCQIKNKAQFHENVFKFFRDRHIDTFENNFGNTCGEKDEIVMKAVLPLVQPSCGIFLKYYTSKLGSLDYIFERIVKSSMHEEKVKLHNYFEKIHNNFCAAIPVYPIVPPFDDPLPLPMIICCCPLNSNNPISAAPSRSVDNAMANIRKCLSWIQVRHPGNELSASIFKSRKDMKKSQNALEYFNVDPFEDHEEFAHLNDSKSFIACFAVSPDGRHIAACSTDGQVWAPFNDKDDINCWQNISPHDSPSQPCCMDVYSCPGDHFEFFIFIAFENSHIDKFSVDMHGVLTRKASICCSNLNINKILCFDENNLIVGLQDGGVALWYTVEKVKDEVESSSAEGKVESIDLKHFIDTSKNFTQEVVLDSQNIMDADLARITCLGINRQCGFVAAGSLNGSVQLWQAEVENCTQKSQCFLQVQPSKITTCHKTFDLKPHRSPVTALTFSVSGSVLYVGCKDGRIVIWDTIMGMHLRTIFQPYMLPCKLFEPRKPSTLDGNTFNGDDEIPWVAAERCYTPPIEPHLRAIRNISLSPDSSLLTVVFQSGHIVFLDAHVTPLTFTDEELRFRPLNEVSSRCSHRDSCKNTSTTSATSSGTGSVNFPQMQNSQPSKQTIVRRKSLKLSSVVCINITPGKLESHNKRDTKIEDLIIVGKKCFVGRRGCIQIINLTEGSEESLLVAEGEYSPFSLLTSCDKRLVLMVYDHQVYDLTKFCLSSDENSESQESGSSSPNPHFEKAIEHAIANPSSEFDVCCELDNPAEVIRHSALDKATGEYLILVTCVPEVNAEQTEISRPSLEYLRCFNKQEISGTLTYKPLKDPWCLSSSHGHCTTVSVASYKQDKKTKLKVIIGTSSGAVISYELNITDEQENDAADSKLNIADEDQQPTAILTNLGANVNLAHSPNCVETSCVESSPDRLKHQKSPDKFEKDETQVQKIIHIFETKTKPEIAAEQKSDIGHGEKKIDSPPRTPPQEKSSFHLALVETNENVLPSEKSTISIHHSPDCTFLHKHLSTVTCSAIADQGRYVITGSVDRTVVVWDTKQADGEKQKKHVLQHDNLVSSLAVCPKTSILMVGCNGGHTVLWYWRTGELLGQLNQSHSAEAMIEPNDEVTALAFSECEQLFAATTSNRRRVKFYFNVVSKDFQRIHSLAAAKQHGLVKRDHFSILPMDSRRVLSFLEHESASAVKNFCKTNARVLREFLLLHGGWFTSARQFGILSATARSEVDPTTVLSVLNNYDRIKDKLKPILEVAPHVAILTISKYGTLIDMLLEKHKSRHAQIAKQSVIDLLNFYSFLLGTPAKELDLDIDEDFWNRSCRKSFAPYFEHHLLGNPGHDAKSAVVPFSEQIDINKILRLCDTEPLLFANFVKTLRPSRNLDCLRSPFARKRTRIKLSMNYLLRGSEKRVVENLWLFDTDAYDEDDEEHLSGPTDVTACDVAIPYFIPLKGIATLDSKFLAHVVQYTEDYGDYSLFKNPVVRMLVEFKWHAFACRRFKADFVILLFWNTCVIVNALLMRQHSRRMQWNKGDDRRILLAMLILRCFIGLILSRFLIREFLEYFGSIKSEFVERNFRKKLRVKDCIQSFIRGSKSYFCIANMIDLAVYTLVALGVVYQTVALNTANYDHKDYVDDIYAITMPFLALNLLSDLAVHDRFGSYIAMMIVMIKSSLAVWVMLALMVVSFAAAFMLSGVHPDGNHIAFMYFNRALLQAYSYVFGGSSFVDMLDADSPNISVILLVIFRFLVSIVLLNVLIGIMATSQGQMMSHGDEAVLLAKANYIVTYENVTFQVPDFLQPPNKKERDENTADKAKIDDSTDNSSNKDRSVNVQEVAGGSSTNVESMNLKKGSLDSMVMGHSDPNAGVLSGLCATTSCFKVCCFPREDTSKESINDQQKGSSLNQKLPSTPAEILEKLREVQPFNDTRKPPPAYQVWFSDRKQKWMRILNRWKKKFTFRSIVRTCYSALLFLVTSGAVIDAPTKKRQFPEYIQILAKDGVDLNKVKAKVTSSPSK